MIGIIIGGFFGYFLIGTILSSIWRFYKKNIEKDRYWDCEPYVLLVIGWPIYLPIGVGIAPWYFVKKYLLNDD